MQPDYQYASHPTDQYDVACISGGLGEGHIPCSGLGELVRVVKPGESLEGMEGGCGRFDWGGA